MPYPLRIGTIGSYIDNGYRVSVHCLEFGCHHSAELDLEALAVKLGRDYDMIEEHDRLVRMLVCEKCGVRGNIQLNISPPSSAGLGAYIRPEDR